MKFSTFLSFQKLVSNITFFLVFSLSAGLYFYIPTLVKARQGLTPSPLPQGSTSVFPPALLPGPETRKNIQPKATFTVSNTGDNAGIDPAPNAGTGTLRQAIVDAIAAGAGPHTINATGVTGTISLRAALPNLSVAITINGPTAGSLTVTRAVATQFRIFTPTASLTLNDLTITNGLVSGAGETGNGGAINTTADLTVNRCVFSGNTAVNGGCIRIPLSTTVNLTVTDCTFTNNTGTTGASGIIATSGTVNIIRSTFSNNTQAVQGALFLNCPSSTITNCTIANNTSGSGAAVGGLTLAGVGTTHTVINTTIVGNSTSGNTVGAGGVRVVGSSSATFTNCLIAGNSSTGNTQGANIDLSNNVTSGSPATVNGSFNLIGAGDGIVSTTLLNGQNSNQVGTNAAPLDAMVGTLGSNGGLTQTIPLLSGSPAINAGTASGTPAADQRGVSRVGATDIGSYEFVPPSTTVSSINRASTNPTCSPASVSWTVTFAGSVTGVTSSNFSLVDGTSSLTGESITGVSGSGTTWTVTASTGTGAGTLGLNMVNSTGVSQSVTNLPFTGQTYTVNAPPATPTITPTPASVCASSTGNTASGPAGATTYNWSITNGTITSATNIQTITYTAGASGTVQLMLTVTNAAGCTASNNANVTINALPGVPTITPTPSSVCASSTGNQASGPAGATTYAWTITNGTITSATNIQTITYTAGASGTVQLMLTVTNASGCSRNNTANVTINAGPATPTITPTPSSVCASSTGNQASGPAGATTYAWTITNGTITSATNIQTITYTAGASGTVQLGLTVTNASGCAASNNANVTINALPGVPTITPTPSSVCASSTGNQASGPAGATTYAWTMTNGTITSATNIQTITYTAGASGTVQLMLTVTNASGCSRNNTANVTINAGPATPTITPTPSSVCASSTGNQASGPAGATTYAWTITNGTITSATNIQTITYTAGASGTVQLGLTVTNASGCAASNNANVTINALPGVPTITPTPSSVCASSTGNQASGPAGATTYAWTITNGTITSATNLQTITYTAGASGTVQLMLTVTNVGGCSASNTANVTINAAPSATITAPGGPLCTGATGNTASVPDAGVGATYNWSITNGTITAGTGTSSITFTAGTVSPLQLSVTVTSSAGCAASGGPVSITLQTCVTGVQATRLWVADTYNNRIQRYESGAWTVVVTPTLNLPEAVTASLDGMRVYVADTGNNKVIYSTDSGASWADFATAGLVGPQGLALDASGHLYVSNTGANQVLRYDENTPLGTPTVLASGGTGAGQVTSPRGLAIDSSNRLFIADQGNSRILRIPSANGTPGVTFQVAGTGVGAAPFGQVKNPEGVAVDNAGNLYVADTGNNRVTRFAGGNNGAATVLCTISASLTAPALGQVRGAEGVAIVDAGLLGGTAGQPAIVVSDTQNRRIQGSLTTTSATGYFLVGTPNGSGSGAGQFLSPGKIR